MAVTRSGKILKFTANADSYTGRLHFNSIRIEGTGMTPGERLILQDINSSLVGEHVVQNANESAAVLESGGEYGCNGLKVAGALAGTWSVLVSLR